MSLEIHIKRNCIEIHKYPFGSEFGIEKTYTVFDYKRRRYDNGRVFYVYDKDRCILTLPRATNYQQLIQKLENVGWFIDHIYDENNENVIPYETIDVSLKPEFKPKNEFQVKAIEFLSHISNDIHYKLLRLPTGDGKTFCALASSANINRRTMVITDTLVDQWSENILKFLTINHKEIYEIRGAESVNDLYDMRNPKFKFYICSLKTIDIAAQNNQLSKLMEYLGIGLKIIDEGHKNVYSLFKIDLSANVSETMYLTATPMRSDNGEDAVYQRAYKMLPSYGESVEKSKTKYHNVIYIEFNTHPSMDEQQMCVNRFFGFSLINYANYLFSNKNAKLMIKIITDMIDKFLGFSDKEDKMVIIFELNKHISMMSKFLENKYDVTIGKYCTLIKDIGSREEELKSKIILTTFKSMGTGTDLPNCRTILNTTTFASNVISKQVIGRLREIPNKGVYYIDMCDLGFQNTIEHQRSRKKVFCLKEKSHKTIDYTKT